MAMMPPVAARRPSVPAKKKAPVPKKKAAPKKAPPAARMPAVAEDVVDHFKEEEVEEEIEDEAVLNQSTKFRDFELDSLMEIIKDVLPSDRQV
jgi:hypothetical protein